MLNDKDQYDLGVYEEETSIWNLVFLFFFLLFQGNHFWEHHLTVTKPLPASDQETKQRFILQKYVEKQFLQPPPQFASVADSLDALLQEPRFCVLFRKHLELEHSTENLGVQMLKRVRERVEKLVFFFFVFALMVSICDYEMCVVYVCVCVFCFSFFFLVRVLISQNFCLLLTSC